MSRCAAIIAISLVACGGDGDSSGGDVYLGEATLTIGSETWEFDSFGCAFGHEATASSLFSFSSNSIGEHSTGARVQMQAEIEDDTSQGRYEGDGVVFTVYINDIDDFTNPSVSWKSSSATSLISPAAETLVRLNGDVVTAEGGFYDRRLDPPYTTLVPGTLDAICGDQSRR